MPTPLQLLTDGRERIFWAYLLAAALIALVLTLLRREPIGAARLKAYFWSADARLDLRYFLVNWLIKGLLIAPLLLSAQSVALWTLEQLNTIAEPPFLPWRYRHIVLAYTVALFVAGDLSRYWLHRWMHHNRWLWAFHKVHHSAEALNPLTFYRLHPLENGLFALRHALVAGLITGGFIFGFGARLDLYTIFGSNLFVVALSAFTSNLRHSHIHLGYGRWLEHLLISPAQHQIHHDPRHLQRNFGSVLALWDWLFGTLRHPHEVAGAPRCGLGAGSWPRDGGVIKLLLHPFVEIHATIQRKRTADLADGRRSEPSKICTHPRNLRLKTGEQP
ncbi:sterol desaturase family protein [Endothiovibrio diazotrophicus]